MDLSRNSMPVKKETLQALTGMLCEGTTVSRLWQDSCVKGDHCTDPDRNAMQRDHTVGPGRSDVWSKTTIDPGRNGKLRKSRTSAQHAFHAERKCSLFVLESTL